MHDDLLPVGKLLWSLARPANLYFLLGLFLLACCFLRSGRTGRVVVALAGLVFALPALPTYHLVLKPLEQRFPTPAALSDRVDGILVLGGAVDPLLTVDHGAPALTGAGERMTTFAALARRHPEARLVFSGGLSARRPGHFTEADAARLLFDQLGLAGRAILYEDKSRNTFENAVFSRRLVQPRGDETWLLITSAAHMPRAMAVFRHLGWTMRPFPVDYRTPARVAFVFDVLGNLEALDVALHEWVGLVAYRLTGRASEYFPAPG